MRYLRVTALNLIPLVLLINLLNLDGCSFTLSTIYMCFSFLSRGSTRYCKELHIPVVIFVSSREDSLTLASSSVFPREELR